MRIDASAPAQTTCGGGGDAQLLADKGGLVARAEGQNFDIEPDIAGGVGDPGGQLAAFEIQSLIDRLEAGRIVAEPDAVDAEIAGQRVGSGAQALDEAFGVLALEPGDDAHAGFQRVLAHPKPDHAVGQVGGKVGAAWTNGRRRADGAMGIGGRHAG